MQLYIFEKRSFLQIEVIIIPRKGRLFFPIGGDTEKILSFLHG